MCIHYHHGLHTCGCLKILPAGGPGYIPPSLCEGVKYAHNLYHTQPDRPPQQFSLPPPQACPPIEATDYRPGNIALVALPEECPLHLGVHGLNKISEQYTIDQYIKLVRSGVAPDKTLFPIYKWGEVRGEICGEFEGEDGSFKELARFCECKITGEELAKQYPDAINFAAVTSSPQSDTDSETIDSSIQTKRIEYRQPRLNHLLHEHAGYPSASQLEAIAKDLEQLSVNNSFTPKSKLHTSSPSQYKSIAYLSYPSTPPQSLKSPRMPGAPRKPPHPPHHRGRSNFKNVVMLNGTTAAPMIDQRNITPSPTNRASLKYRPPPKVLLTEKKDPKPVVVRVSLAVENFHAASENPHKHANGTHANGAHAHAQAQALFRPRPLWDIQPSESTHRRTKSV